MDALVECTVMEIMAANQPIVIKQVKITVVRGLRKKFLIAVSPFLLIIVQGKTTSGTDTKSVMSVTANV